MSALKRLGHEARGLALKCYREQRCQDIEHFDMDMANPRSPRNLPGLCRLWARALPAAMRADVIHWHFNTAILPFRLDLRFLCLIRKPRLVEFWGSDIRIPETAAADNPFFRDHLMGPTVHYPISKEGSRMTQEAFSRNGFACLIPSPEQEAYVFDDLFPDIYRTRARVFVRDVSPRYPPPYRQVPVVVHVPSVKERKGTAQVVQVVERLQKTHRFEFRLVHGVSREEAQRIMGGGDIVIDQLVLGTYGLVSIEAMALGKPVVCYVKPAVRAGFPPGLPIVQATPNDMETVLGALLTDGERRHHLGIRGRTYAEQHHDALSIAGDLVRVYRELITARDRKGILPGGSRPRGV